MTTVDREPPGGGRFDEAGDATRRTHLANERTYLAWWRTGLTCLAVSFGAGKLVPSLGHETRWPYVVVGAGFAVLGFFFIGYAFVRLRAVRDAVMRGEFARPDDRLMAVVTALGALISIAVLVIVIVQT